MKTFQSFSPGSVMLLGEHSVVAGYPAIGIAVDQFLKIEWRVREEGSEGCKGNRNDNIKIISALGEYQSSWKALDQHPNLSFVIATLEQFAIAYPQIKQVSLELTIQSDIDPFWGLGSSAAVVAATLSGLAQIYLKQHLRQCPNEGGGIIKLEEAFTIGLKAILQIQGSGSGTDLAISLAGGCVGFHPNTQKISLLPLSLPFTLVYVGYKTPTPEVLKQVRENWKSDPDGLKQLYRSMGDITQKALSIKQMNKQTNKLENLGSLMNQYQILMQKLGVSDKQTENLLVQLHSNADFFGVKISGSGLGDCLIALGKSQKLYDNQINLNSTSLGAWGAWDT